MDCGGENRWVEGGGHAGPPKEGSRSGAARGQLEAITLRQAPPPKGHDLSGAMTGGTYPSSRTTTYTYDQAGQLSGFSGTLGDGTSRGRTLPSRSTARQG
ncbi:MAG TPA: hypothetical protein VGB07_25250 [Blastocatellia bacterium]